MSMNKQMETYNKLKSLANRAKCITVEFPGGGDLDIIDRQLIVDLVSNLEYYRDLCLENGLVKD